MMINRSSLRPVAYFSQFSLENAITSYLNILDPVARRNREQALTAIPLMSAYLSGQYVFENADHLKSVVDMGFPLIDAISEFFDVPKVTVRKMIGLNPERFGACWLEEPGVLLRHLAYLPPEFIPDTEENWRTFTNLTHALKNYLPDETGDELPDKNLGVKWLREWGSIGFDAETKKLPIGTSPESSLQEVRDLLNEGMIVLNDQESAKLFSTYSFFRLAAISREWHRELLKSLHSEIESEKFHSGYEIHWEPIWKHPFQVYDLVIVPLTTNQQLQLEGLRLSHCVGTYVDQCIAGTSHIYSIRNLQDESISTVEFEIANEFSIELAQHFGMENTSPTAEAESAVALFHQFLQQLVSEAHLRKLIQEGQLRKQKASTLLQDKPLRVELLEKVLARKLK